MPVTGAEVIEVVKQLLGGRAAGVDEIHHEFLNTLNVVALSWLTHLSAWQSKATTLTGVVP